MKRQGMFEKDSQGHHLLPRWWPFVWLNRHDSTFGDRAGFSTAHRRAAARAAALCRTVAPPARHCSRRDALGAGYHTLVRRMDELVILDRGRIVERGAHDTLLADDGIYAALWRHQSG